MKFSIGIAAGALLGCSGALWAHPGHTHAPSKPAPHQLRPQTRNLSGADSGHTISARVGDQISVKLASNASTGYEWMVLNADSKVLAVQGEGEYIAGANPNHMAGVPGTQIWRFKALKPGQAKIKLGYMRRFEKVAPAQTWMATINVK